MRSTRNRETLVVLILLVTIYTGTIAHSFAGEFGLTMSQSGFSSVTPFSLGGVVGTNMPVVGEASPDRQQAETTIAVDPRNPDILVAGAQDLRLKSSGEHRWHGYYRSTDGGQTWTDSLLPGYPGDTSPQGLASPLHKSNATSDPVLTFDRLGNVYYAGLVFNISAAGFLGNGPITGTTLFVAKFTNDGATYGGVTLVPSAISADKEWIATDNTGGPNDGNVYVAVDAYLGSTAAPYATVFTRSMDGGRTFSTPFYVPADQTGGLPGVTVDSSGNVYVLSDAFDPVTGANLNYIQVSKLTNGGTTLVQNVRAVDPATWITSGTDIGASFRAFTIPQIAADARGIYVVFDDRRLGNSNVYLTRSTDGGSTWTVPFRVNDVLTGQHFFPTIAVSGGIIDIAWYDSRFNTMSPMNALDVFFADSFDGGVSFSSSTRVTSLSFDPGRALRTDAPNYNEPFMGDYFEIAATPSTVHPLWVDDRYVCDSFDSNYASCVDQDAFTATIALPDFAISDYPSSLTVTQGSSGTAKVSLFSFNTFQGSVAISVSSTPTGLATSPISTTVPLPSGGTGSFNLTFSPGVSTPATMYKVNITGAGGPRTHSLFATVVVLTSSVGGSIVNANELQLQLELAVIVGPVVVVFTLGTLRVLAWRKRRCSSVPQPPIQDHDAPNLN